MCSKCIFGNLASHCGFCTSILDVYFPLSFEINQINIFDLNIEITMETGRRLCCENTKLTSKHFKKFQTNTLKWKT